MMMPLPDVVEKKIRGKRVSLVEDHHHVLIPWARERVRSTSPFMALTLDHHTDTLRAFTHFSEVAGTFCSFSADYHSEPELLSMLEKLRHDEHISFALQNDILSRAVLFTHVNFAVNLHPGIQIIHHAPSDETKETLADYYARALETEFLEKNLAEARMPEEPFILDIDLDYFKTPQSVEPEDASAFYELIRKSMAVTISRERDWVRLLNLDFDRKVTAEYLEERLLKHIDNALR